MFTQQKGESLPEAFEFPAAAFGERCPIHFSEKVDEMPELAPSISMPSFWRLAPDAAAGGAGWTLDEKDLSTELN